MKTHFPEGLAEWAVRHNLTPSALHELRALLVCDIPPPPGQAGASEAAIQSRQRLAAARSGIVLWRNNVGCLSDERGVPLRYGLANESAPMNQMLKSADLIGWRKLIVAPEHVGRPIAQFVSLESKRGDWRFTGKGREAAQARWCEIVTEAGGLARISNAENPFD